MNIFFTYPLVLWALSLVIIPIIIHLFSFRKYQHVFFHSIFLLQESQDEQNRTRTKLQEILILISRIIAITFLVFAFAQPFIPLNSGKSEANQTVSIYIDNSLSMQNETQEGIALEIAKSRALSILDAYTQDHMFYIITNNPSMGEQIPLTKQHAEQKISEIQPSPFSPNMSDICLQAHSLDLHKKNSLYIISDFQKHTSDIQNFLTDSLFKITCIPIIPEKTNNVSIDSVWFDSPYRTKNQIETIHVRISNSGNQIYSDFPVQLFINDTLRAISNIQIEPNNSVELSMEYTISYSGIVTGKISLEDYPILFDNNYYFAYTIRNTIQTLIINENNENTYISNLLHYDDYIKITQNSRHTIEYAKIPNYDVLILHELQEIPSGLIHTVEEFLSLGKTCIIIPQQNISINSYNECFAQFSNHTIIGYDTSTISIARIDKNHSIFNQVFESEKAGISYPEVYSHFVIEPSSNQIITLANKHSFLSNISLRKGSCYVFTAPLQEEYGNFVTHPLFISVYNMTLLVKNTQTIQTKLGDIIKILEPNNNSQSTIHIIEPEKSIDFIPLTQSSIHSQELLLECFDAIQEAGIYYASLEDSIISGIAINYSRNESDMNFYTSQEIQDLCITYNKTNTSLITGNTDSIQTRIRETSKGIQLWRYALIIALFAIFLEMFLIRFWNKGGIKKNV